MIIQTVNHNVAINWRSSYEVVQIPIANQSDANFGFFIKSMKQQKVFKWLTLCLTVLSIIQQMIIEKILSNLNTSLIRLLFII